MVHPHPRTYIHNGSIDDSFGAGGCVDNGMGAELLSHAEMPY